MRETQIRPYFTTRGLFPENQETPIHFLHGSVYDPTYWFLRNHFQYPSLTKDSGNLMVTGAVEQPFIIGLEDIKKLPRKTLTVPLICAGNQREKFKPKVFGEQWEEGALSQGVWTGVSLKDIIDYAVPKKKAVEVVFTGEDRGMTPNVDKTVPFERSLPLDKALHADTIIAYEYNKSFIPYKHGYPLRLIVPNWYAMASIKWLHKITVIDHPYEGPFQTEDYIYYPNYATDKGKTPVTTLNVNSLIQQPLNYSIIKEGKYEIVGLAWSGEGTIVEVELSFDEGKTWEQVPLVGDHASQYAWTEWRYLWKTPAKGRYTIKSRAKDFHGRVQPEQEYWNRKGYGYNAIFTIEIKVE